MRKIPTVFERDWAGDKSRVVDQIHFGCEWVLAGEGVATRKLDGTSCMVREGKLYKRRELRRTDAIPQDFESSDYDIETGKIIGWMPVGDGPEDRWHREAFSQTKFEDGTYELLGPKVQDNQEGFDCHTLQRHSLAHVYPDVPRTFDGIREWLAEHNYIEGLVFHHPDGKMAKVKLRDFGIKRELYSSGVRK